MHRAWQQGCIVGIGGGIVEAADDGLQQAAFRDQVRAMHAKQTPLVEMADTLGLPMSAPVRAIVAGLKATEVQEIRRATLEALDRAENKMPIDCTVSWDDINKGDPVAVTVADEQGKATIQVRPTKA
jgi:hypothetical protein